MRYINILVEMLQQRNIPMFKASEEQMSKVYSIISGENLPKAYIEFMSVMGNGTGGHYMGGDSCFMDEIFDLRQGAIELLEENESINILTDEDFVFWMSQGCMFCFFKLTEGDNPPIYFYNESGEDKFIKIAESLVEFLINRLEMNRSLFVKNNNSSETLL